MKICKYRVTEEVYDWIINGTKRIEVRLYNEKSSQINIDDIIEFKVLNNEDVSIKVKVVALLRYKTIKDLLNDVDNSLVFNKNISNNELEDMLINIFGEEEVKTHNILGIKFEIIQ